MQLSFLSVIFHDNWKDKIKKSYGFLLRRIAD